MKHIKRDSGISEKTKEKIAVGVKVALIKRNLLR